MPNPVHREGSLFQPMLSSEIIKKERASKKRRYKLRGEIETKGWYTEAIRGLHCALIPSRDQEREFICFPFFAWLKNLHGEGQREQEREKEGETETVG